VHRRAFSFALVVACASRAQPVPRDDNPLGTTFDVEPRRAIARW
jgi:hypothetical protein